MREILYRAISVDKNKFVFGYYVKGSSERHFISNPYGVDVQVYANSVCQYTGLNDFYGNKIFENDIMCAVKSQRKEEYTVLFINGAFRVKSNMHDNILCLSHSCKRQMLKSVTEIKNLSIH